MGAAARVRSVTVGPLSRVPWSVRAIAFAVAIIVLVLLFGFDWPIWIGAGVGGWIGLTQWRRERAAGGTA